jgi:hypothetical protein
MKITTDDLLLQDDEIGEWIQLSFFIYVSYINTILILSAAKVIFRNWTLFWHK